MLWPIVDWLCGPKSWRANANERQGNLNTNSFFVLLLFVPRQSVSHLDLMNYYATRYHFHLCMSQSNLIWKRSCPSSLCCWSTSFSNRTQAVRTVGSEGAVCTKGNVWNQPPHQMDSLRRNFRAIGFGSLPRCFLRRDLLDRRGKRWHGP